MIIVMARVAGVRDHAAAMIAAYMAIKIALARLAGSTARAIAAHARCVSPGAGSIWKRKAWHSSVFEAI
jgi:hypothetical protein